MNSAYEIPNLRFSLLAGEDIARRRFISVNSSSEGVIATAAGSAIGVSMNQAADDEVLEIADGIVMVEAGGIIAAGADVEVGANGKAVAKTTGIGVGVALTGATGAGQLVAVKLMSVSNANGADGTDGTDGTDAPLVQTFVYTAADLDAGADITDAIIGIVPAGYDATVADAQVISTGDAAGIDAENTSVVLLEVGSTKIAEVTFDADNDFPAAGVAEAITLIPAAAELEAGSVLLLTVTNGAAANLPVFMVQITLTLTPAV